MIQLEDSIASQPQDPSNYLKLIDILREQCDDECSIKLEYYRNLYCNLFYASKEFWRDWITDKLCIRTLFLHDIEDFFKLAIKFCPHIDIISDLIDYVLDQYEQDKIVDQDVYRIFEYCISICGIDYHDGGLIWKRYREFVTDEYNDFLNDEENEIEEIDIHNFKESIIKVYLRQLSLPLKDNKTCLQELESLLSNICVESDISLVKPELFQEKYSASCTQSVKISVYETLISQLSGKNINGRVLFDDKLIDFYGIWKLYINYEVNINQNLIRAQRLYERAILENPGCMVLWQEYVEFVAYTLQNWVLVECITNRALKLHKSNFNMWNLRLLSLEYIYTSDPNELNEDNLMKALDVALFSAFETYEAYLSIILYSCDFRRRNVLRLKLSSEINTNYLRESILLLRNCFEKAEKYVITYFPGYEEGYLKLIKYRIHCEETLISGLIGTLPSIELLNLCVSEKDVIDIWENVLTNYPKSCYSWLEYINWCKGKNNEHCRGLFNKATSNRINHTEIICQEWMKFEQQYGNFNDVLAATVKINVVLSKIVHDSENVSVSDNFINSDYVKKKEFNNNNFFDNSNNNDGKSHTIDVSNTKKRARVANQRNDTITGTMIIDDNIDVKNKQDNKGLIRDPFTVFVTKFSENLDENGLKTLFSAAGDIVGVKLFRDKNTGVSQCKGLVQFSTHESKNNALKLSQSIIDGCKITVLTSKFPCLPYKNTEKSDLSEIKGTNNDVVENDGVRSAVPTKIKTKSSVLGFKPRSMKLKL